MPPLLHPALGKRRSGRNGGLATAAALLGTALFPALAFATEPAKKITYEDDVLPIFRDNCLKCHNPDKLKGDLDLTSFSGAIKGGGSGVTLNARDPDGSLLFYNDAAEGLLGHRFDETGELLARQWSTMFLPTDYTRTLGK